MAKKKRGRRRVTHRRLSRMPKMQSSPGMTKALRTVAAAAKHKSIKGDLNKRVGRLEHEMKATAKVVHAHHSHIENQQNFISSLSGHLRSGLGAGKAANPWKVSAKTSDAKQLGSGKKRRKGKRRRKTAAAAPKKRRAGKRRRKGARKGKRRAKKGAAAPKRRRKGARKGKRRAKKGARKGKRRAGKRRAKK